VALGSNPVRGTNKKAAALAAFLLVSRLPKDEMKSVQTARDSLLLPESESCPTSAILWLLSNTENRIMDKYTIMEGSPGLTLGEVSHMVIPGRGRSGDGMSLSEPSLARAIFAADVWVDSNFAEGDGFAICSGYKSPRDHTGQIWLSPDFRRYRGKPEADSMGDVLMDNGVQSWRIQYERNSPDTATNLAFCERDNCFGKDDERPTVFIAQEGQLERIIRDIAPRVMRRDFLGIVVPEDKVPDPDSRLARLATRATMLGIKPEDPRMPQKVANHSKAVWDLVGAVDLAHNALRSVFSRTSV